MCCYYKYHGWPAEHSPLATVKLTNIFTLTEHTLPKTFIILEQYSHFRIFLLSKVIDDDAQEHISIDQRQIRISGALPSKGRAIQKPASKSRIQSQGSYSGIVGTTTGKL